MHNLILNLLHNLLVEEKKKEVEAELERAITGFPKISIEPPFVLTSPRIALNVVLFPAPFFPINPVTLGENARSLGFP